MTGKPVELDAYRTPDNQVAVAFRRHESESGGCDTRISTSVRDPALRAQLLTGPAESWIDLCRKLAFLIDGYAKTPEAQDLQTQILIRRALGDVARLSGREEHKP